MLPHDGPVTPSRRSPVGLGALPPVIPMRSANEPAQLRSATLILPRTGERVRRSVTLRPPFASTTSEPRLGGQQDGPHASEPPGPESLLLPASARRRSRRKSGRSHGRLWRYELKWRAKQARSFLTSKTGVGILKCSLAYLLGSMGTFVPFLSEYLGSRGGKHMVATVTVYFHPARSLGSAFEAVACAAVAFIYATVISFTSMWVSVLFDDHLHKIALGHAIILVVFCGGGLGFVGWIKQRLERPLVGVACSLTSLVIITVLTKEGSVQAGDFSPEKIIQVLKIVSLGVLFTTVVNLLILPVSARQELREGVRDFTESLGEMLVIITRGFLTGSEEELEAGGFQQAVDRHKSCSNSMRTNLREAKWEHYVFGTEREYALQKKLVGNMQRMAQTIGGLRSAATTQFALLDQPAVGGGATPSTAMFTPGTAGFNGSLSRMGSWLSFPESSSFLERIDEIPHEGDQSSPSGPPTAQSATEIFEKFLAHLGPSMKSLAFTQKLILDELPYGPAPTFEFADHAQFRSSLTEANNLYKNARKEALAMLYKTKELSAPRPFAIEADFEEVAASCGYFSFSLQNCAEEIQNYLDILDELKQEIEKPFWSRRSWHWLKFWRQWSPREITPTLYEESTADEARLVTPNGQTSGRANGNATYEPGTSKDEAINLGLFNKMRRPNSSLSYRLWRSFSWLRRDDTKYAIKVGLGAALYATPSFIAETRAFYGHWRGEWGLLSYMLVCSMTIGSSNTTGFSRAYGTCLGAVAAICAWLVSQGNVYIMALLGWLMCLYPFYLIVVKGQGPFGRFILLTYNLSALYAYAASVSNIKRDDGEEDSNNAPLIGPIALHRVVAVLSGCLWGLFITRFVWPISARDKFRNGLSLLLLRMGLIWKRDPLHRLPEGETAHPYMNIREELQLQKYYGRLESLRTSAGYEFELKGPFPTDQYGQALKSVARMLDAYHAMNEVIMKDQQASTGESEILQATLTERNQLCSRISHLFQVMASSIKLEFPLNDALPNTDNARDRLLVKVFQLRKEMRKSQRLNDEDFALIYAFGEFLPEDSC